MPWWGWLLVAVFVVVPIVWAVVVGITAQRALSLTENAGAGGGLMTNGALGGLAR